MITKSIPIASNYSSLYGKVIGDIIQTHIDIVLGHMLDIQNLSCVINLSFVPIRFIIFDILSL